MKKTTQQRILARQLATTLKPLTEEDVKRVSAGAFITAREAIIQLMHNTATGPGGYADASDADVQTS